MLGNNENAKVWVHVGLPKCGSTTIQRYFARRERFNSKQGLCYPVTVRSASGFRSHKPLADLPPSALADAASKIRTEAGVRSKILISHEGFTGALPGGGLCALMGALNREFGTENVQLLAYFRNVFDFVESSFSQFVFAGLFHIRKKRFFGAPTQDLECFVQLFEEKKGFPIFSLLGHAEAIRSCAPNNAVTLCSNERSDLGERDMIADLCERLAIRVKPMARRFNTRLTGRSLAAMLYAQQRYSKSSYESRIQALRAFGATDQKPICAQLDPRFAIPEQMRNVILETAAVERSRIAGLFSTPVDALLEDRWRLGPSVESLSVEDKARVDALFAC